MIVINKDGGEIMVNVKELLFTADNVEKATNPKEEYEIVNALFQGNYMYEERNASRLVKILKIMGEL